MAAPSGVGLTSAMTRRESAPPGRLPFPSLVVLKPFECATSMAIAREGLLSYAVRSPEAERETRRDGNG